MQFATLLIYFSATLVFIDTPHRLHLMVRTIMIFGFVLAIFGLTQSFTSPTKVYWMRELNQSTAFGPFINRHHFAGYMELTIALPLGLLFAGAVDKEKRLLFIFIAGLDGRRARNDCITRRDYQSHCGDPVSRRRDGHFPQAHRGTASTKEPA